MVTLASLDSLPNQAQNVLFLGRCRHNWAALKAPRIRAPSDCAPDAFTASGRFVTSALDCTPKTLTDPAPPLALTGTAVCRVMEKNHVSR